MKIKRIVMENFFGQMDVPIKEIGVRVSNMEKVYIFHSLEVKDMENGILGKE